MSRIGVNSVSFHCSLAELYLTPINRISDYVRILSWLKANTPSDHPDRNDLASALQLIKEVDRVIRQVRLHQENTKQRHLNRNQ